MHDRNAKIVPFRPRQRPRRFVYLRLQLADGSDGRLRFDSDEQFRAFIRGKKFHADPHPTLPRVRIAKEA